MIPYIITHLNENIELYSNVSPQMADTFHEYKTQIIWAYRSMKLILDEHQELEPLVSRTRAIAAFNSETQDYRLISGQYTEGEGRRIVNKLGFIRYLYLKSNFHYAKAIEKENILDDNNVGYKSEPELVGHSFGSYMSSVKALIPAPLDE